MRIKKYIAEFVGTFVLVFIGCGTAMLVGCDASVGGGYILTALAFGLAIVAMAYSVGNISGCHLNPAVSFAFMIRRELSVSDFIGYVISQIIGAFCGSLLHYFIWVNAGLQDMTGSFGSNGLSGVNGSYATALAVEIVLTAIFVFAIMGVTSKKTNHGSFGGLVIGLSLTLVHLFGIGLTGTSVNPARSLGPALMSLIAGNPAPIKDVWIFVAAPLLGAAIAALLYIILERDKPEKKLKSE